MMDLFLVDYFHMDMICLVHIDETCECISSHFGVELELIQLSRDIHQRRCGILHVFGIGTSAIADWTLPSASWSDRPDILQLHAWHTLKINQT